MLCNRITRGLTVNSKVREGFLKEAAFELTSEVMSETEPDPKGGQKRPGQRDWHAQEPVSGDWQQSANH